MISQTYAKNVENISLFIPHVYPNFTEEFISGVFDSLGIGQIGHIDLVSKIDRNGKQYNSAYIHFKLWYCGKATQDFQKLVKDPYQEARVSYSDSRYWVVLENAAKKHSRRRIDLSDSAAEVTDVDIKMLEIAPGVSQMILSQKMLDEIDEIVDKCYEESKMRGGNSYPSSHCEIDCNEEFNMNRLRVENRMLREENRMLKEENEALTRSLEEKEKQLNIWFDARCDAENDLNDINKDLARAHVEISDLKELLDIMKRAKVSVAERDEKIQTDIKIYEKFGLPIPKDVEFLDPLHIELNRLVSLLEKSREENYARMAGIDSMKEIYRDLVEKVIESQTLQDARDFACLKMYMMNYKTYMEMKKM